MSDPPVIDFDTDQRQLAERINRMPRPLQILEAGCGRRWTLAVDQPYRLTGIDLDADALKARQEGERDLDEAIVGDITTIDLPAGAFDVVYSAFVLEHIDGARVALENFERWLRPGGLLVLKVPDSTSFYGRAAKLTPHWFHVWFYRVIRKVPTAGTRGHGPYPTHYDPEISRRGFEAFCRDRGLVLESTRFVDNYIRGSRVFGLAGRLVGLVSLGRIPWRWNDLTYVARKPVE